MPESHVGKNRWKRRFFVLVVLWITTTVLMSFPTFRGLVAYPLYRHDSGANGQVAYVMADGYAYWERVHAASDLYHMNRVSKVLILDERSYTMYSFTRDKSETIVERAIQHLLWLGVPREDIEIVPIQSDAIFGTLREAQSVLKYNSEFERIVVVTSAPHTRRSELCFRRVFPTETTVMVHSASSPSQSWEIDAPIWMEYTKLIVYWFVA
ncbi:MAG: ElyC/SanA/YdcF family protein [Planctomycetota bacterium]